MIYHFAVNKINSINLAPVVLDRFSFFDIVVVYYKQSFGASDCHIKKLQFGADLCELSIYLQSTVFKLKKGSHFSVIIFYL